jgi:hypothetical protein
VVLAILMGVVACGSPTASSAPLSSVPAASAGPPVSPSVTQGSPAPTAVSETPPALPTQLVLGQTFGLAYDPVLEQIVLVNGTGEGDPARPTELWRWSGTAWELIDAAGPPARSFAAVARDPQRGVIVVHGGLDGRGQTFDETLEWDGRDWTVHAAGADGPGPREGAGLAWDATADRLVLFGGAVAGEQPADTWGWDGAAWERLATAGPQPRFVSLMTEDSSTGTVVLQGGHWVDGDDGDFLGDTWRWDGTSWVRPEVAGGPGPRVNAPGAWDERLGGIVLFGGGTGLDTPFGADTWLWSEGWEQVPTDAAPNARNGHALAFDAKRQVLVLVGGIASPGGRQRLDVWELDADGWREALPAPE